MIKTWQLLAAAAIAVIAGPFYWCARAIEQLRTRVRGFMRELSKPPIRNPGCGHHDERRTP